LGLLACKADIPDGVYTCKTRADCPAGFTCRADADGSELFCFAGEDGTSSRPDAGGVGGRQPTSGAGGTDGGADSGSGGSSSGAGGRGGSGDAGDGGRSGSDMPEPVAPTHAAFSTVGERRGDADFVLHDDGFEHGERLCTQDRAMCVTGGFTP
jgi:hypothetical protein